MLSLLKETGPSRHPRAPLGVISVLRRARPICGKPTSVPGLCVVSTCARLYIYYVIVARHYNRHSWARWHTAILEQQPLATNPSLVNQPVFSVRAHAQAERGRRKSAENTVWQNLPGFWDTNRNLSEPIRLQYLRYWILRINLLNSCGRFYTDAQEAFLHRFTQLAP